MLFKLKRPAVIVLAVIVSMVMSLGIAFTDNAASASNDNCVQGMSTGKTVTAHKKPYKLSKKMYKRIRGWWHENGSSGCMKEKFTRSKVKNYYHPLNGQREYVGSDTIKGCKVVHRDGVKYYRIRIKAANGCKYCLAYSPEENVMECYNSWKMDPNKYSGSGSLSRGYSY